MGMRGGWNCDVGRGLGFDGVLGGSCGLLRGKMG